MAAAARTIAVLDDDESVRRALRRLLRSEAFPATAFGSAEEFLEAPHRMDFACLIVDIHLGKMSGLELVEQLADEGSRIPVIVITAYDSDTAREAASRVKVHAYLRKPVNAEILLEAVRTAVGAGRGRPMPHLERKS